MTENIFENAILQWRDNRGNGSVVISPPFDEKVMILGILERVYAHKPDTKTIIITDSFDDRTKLVEFLTHTSCEENNKEFKDLLNKTLLKVYTTQFVQGLQTFDFRLCILYKVYSLPEYVERIFMSSVFKLIVNTKLADNETMSKFNSVVPIITGFEQNIVDKVRTSSPVEEIRLGLPLLETSEDYLQLEEYNSYIATSISVFGSFDIMQQCRIGNKSLNLSASDICNRISSENGWSETLDMSMEYNRKIDEIYNPNNLRDRASNTYNIIRERRILLASNTSKLEAINKVVQENPGKKILIISAFPDFASKITDYLNVKAGNIVCMNYHDKLPTIPAIDINGNPVYIKSGTKKGERKQMAAKAQMSLANTLFNLDKINIISANSAPNKDLAIDIDIIIITSPICGDITNYRYRLDKCVFHNNLKLFMIYMLNTLEAKTLQSKSNGDNKVITENFGCDENYSDFSIVD